MHSPKDDEAMELMEEVKKSIPLYSFHICLAPDKTIIVVPECSEAVDAVHKEFGKEYLAVEETFLKDINDSVCLYGKGVELIKRGDKSVWEIIPKEIREKLEE